MQFQKTKRATLLPMLALLALPFIGCQSDQAAGLAADEGKPKVEPYFIYDLGSNPKKIVTTIGEPSLYTSISNNIKVKNVPGVLERFYATYDSVSGKLNTDYLDQIPATAMPKNSAANRWTDYATFGAEAGPPAGWTQWSTASNGEMSGTVGKSRPVYAFQFRGYIDAWYYQTHHAQWGWLPPVAAGGQSGCSQANADCYIPGGTPLSVPRLWRNRG
jgi:hypothetical protein